MSSTSTNSAVPSPLQVGQRVRVIQVGGLVERALVGLVEDERVELILDHDASEIVASRQEVFPLLPFELEEDDTVKRILVSGEVLRGRSAQLVAIGDYRAARAQLLLAAAAMARLESWPPEKAEEGEEDEVMCLVLVPLGGSAASSASAPASSAEEEKSASSREEAVPLPWDPKKEEFINANRFRPLGIDPEICCCMATYALKIVPPDPVSAIEDCTFALGSLKYLEAKKTLSEREKKAKFDAHYLRCHALVLQSHFSLAAEDIRKAVFLNPNDKKARQMVAVVKQRRARAKADNAKLSKEISKWISSVSTKRPSVLTLKRPSIVSDLNKADPEKKQ